jgi:hypothetical protein
MTTTTAPAAQLLIELDPFSAIKAGKNVFEMATSTASASAKPYIHLPWFDQQMERLWTSPERGNVINDDLKKEWSSIATLFTEAMSEDQPQVHSYNGQMGLGKSQAAQVACGVLAAQYFNHRFTTITKSWGALLIVELKTQADEAAQTINRVYQALTGRSDEAAIAKHSGNDVTFQDINDYPVLVICHQAYANSLQRLNDGSDTTIKSFARWKGGERKLVIVDESFNPVSEYTLTPEVSRTILGWMQITGVSHRLAKEFPQEWSTLITVDMILNQLTEEEGDTTALFNQLFDARIDLQRLYRELADVEWDRVNLATNARDKGNKAKTVSNYLRSVDRFITEWSFFWKKGNTNTVNSASWLIPDSVGSIVILDGTAAQDEIYSLFPKLIRHKTQPSLRNFDNVTVHIRHELASLGKSKLAEKGVAEQRAMALYDWLKTNLTPERKVLVCGHIKLENDLIDIAKADPYFSAFHTSHWGATTGRNDWRDCDVAVSASCNFRDRAWAASAVMTSIGVAEGLKHLNRRARESLVSQLIHSKVAVDILQMVFRSRIRKVTDKEGGCQPADLFILLPKDNDERPGEGKGSYMRERILNELHGAEVKEWKFDGYSKKSVTRQPAKEVFIKETAILRYLEALPTGMTPTSDLLCEVGIKTSAWNQTWKKRLSGDLKSRLEEMGIEMISKGWGRSQKVYFEKT